MKKYFFFLFCFLFIENLFTITLSVQNTSGTCGQTNVPVYINIDNAAGLLAFQFDIYFDNTKIDFISADKTSLTSNFLIAFNDLGNYVKFAAASGTPVPSGSGAICVLYFNVISTTDGSSNLDITNSLVNDIPPEEIDGVFSINGCCLTPSGMQNINVSDLDPCADTGVQINWSDPSSWGDQNIGTRYFQVLRDGVDISGNLSASTHSFKDDSGTNNLSYFYQVKAINGCGAFAVSSGVSASDNFFFPPQCSSNPSPSNGNINLPTSLKISWASVQDASNYIIYFGTEENPPYFSQTNNNYYDLINLAPDTTYFWKILPENVCGKPSDCEIWKFTTGKTTPEFTEFFLIPAGAHSTGGYGSYWKTDLSICNFSNSSQIINLALLKAGQDNSNPDNFEFQIQSNKCIGFLDIYWEKFSYEGAGALKVSSPTDALKIESRTYNDTSSGTYGQFISGIDKNKLLQKNEIAHIGFLQKNENYRTNIGFSSLSENLIEIKLELFSSEGEKLGEKITNLLPLSYVQLNDIFSQIGIQNISFAYAKVSSPSENSFFISYASVVDNRSNDPIFIPGLK